MRCAKCGYVTFDGLDDCPKCAKRLPKSLVSPRIRRSRKRGGRLALSSLTLFPIPRYYGAPGDPEVVSLLEAGRGGAPLPASAPGGPRTDRAEAASAVAVESGGAPPEAEGFGDDLESIFETEDAGGGAAVSASDEPAPAEEASDAVAEEEIAGLWEEALEEPSGGAATEPPASESREETSGGDMEFDLGGDLLPGEENPEEKPPETGTVETADEEDLDSLWEEAMAEPQGAEAGAGEVLPEAPAAEAAAEASRGGDAEEDLSQLWDEALTEQGAAGEVPQGEAPAGEPAAEAPPAEEGIEGPAASELGEDLSGMWDEAFAAQAAAEAETEAGEAGESEAPSGAGDDLEDLWGEAFQEEADAGREAAAETDSDAAPEEGTGEDILPQEDLDALIAASSDPEAKFEEEEEETASDSEKDAPGVEEESVAASPSPLEDEEEIEAFIPGGDEEEEEGEEEGAAEAGGGEEESEEEEAVAVAVEEEAEPGEENPSYFSQRLFAACLDAGVVGGLGGLFAAGTHIIVSETVGPIFSNMEALLMVLALDLVVLLLLSFLYSVYFVGTIGTTLGQKFFGITVVDMANRPVGYMQAVLRYFGGLAATLLLGMGHLLVLFDKKGRGLGDRLAGTKVVLAGGS